MGIQTCISFLDTDAGRAFRRRCNFTAMLKALILILSAALFAASAAAFTFTPYSDSTCKTSLGSYSWTNGQCLTVTGDSSVSIFGVCNAAGTMANFCEQLLQSQEADIVAVQRFQMARPAPPPCALAFACPSNLHGDRLRCHQPHRVLLNTCTDGAFLPAACFPA